MLLGRKARRSEEEKGQFEASPPLYQPKLSLAILHARPALYSGVPIQQPLEFQELLKGTGQVTSISLTQCLYREDSCNTLHV